MKLPRKRVRNATPRKNERAVHVWQEEVKKGAWKSPNWWKDLRKEEEQGQNY